MLYLDSSALVKLVLREDESDAVRTLFESKPQRTSSVIAAVEMLIAVRRADEPADVANQAKQLLESVDLLSLDDEVVGRAQMGPVIRALDAIHLATALTLGDELEGLVTYDVRLQDAARELGVPVLAPSPEADQPSNSSSPASP